MADNLERVWQETILKQIRWGAMGWPEARQKMERFYYDRGVSPAEAMRKIQEFIVPYLGGQDFWTATAGGGGGGLQPVSTAGDISRILHGPGGGLQPRSTGGGGLQPTATGGGGLQPTSTGDGGLGLGDIAELYDPYTAFLQGLGVGGRTSLSPVERYGVQQWRPANALFELGRRLGLLPGGGTTKPENLQNYALEFARQPGGASDVARSYLRNIMALTPEQRTEAQLGFGPTYEGGEQMGGLEPPVESSPGGEGPLIELQNLLRLAYGGRGGGQYGNWLAGRMKGEQQLWASRKAAGEAQDPFLEYLQKKYNLQF